jgi:arsenate reductase
MEPSKMIDRPNVLFLCTGNSCRSQMAEGFARKLLGNGINAYSAGIDPHGMNPLAMQVMAEANCPIDTHHSKRVNDLKGIDFDLIVTVCGHADEACPAIPGPSRRIHRGFDDPPKLAKDAKTQAEALSHYRRVRDEIRRYIAEKLMADLAGSES